MKINIPALLIIYLLKIFNLQAQGETFQQLEGDAKEEFKKNLFTASMAISSLECTFNQIQNLSLLTEKISSQGIMVYQKPDALLWRYFSPYKFDFLLNNGTITTKSDGKLTTFDSGKSPIMKDLCKIMIAGLKGDLVVLENSFYAGYYSNGINYKISLAPREKRMASFFNRLDLIFDPETYLVSSLEFVEKSGDNTLIKIGNIRINGAINNEVFSIH
jgi:outer membrane lipoprotein carrier protein